jgi:hypothetical protein
MKALEEDFLVKEKKMIPTRVTAISTEVAESVRQRQKDPHYNLPAYTDMANGDAPCRHCLKIIPAGEQAMLFTYDAFEGIEKLPLPGPVYIHAERVRPRPSPSGAGICGKWDRGFGGRKAFHTRGGRVHPRTQHHGWMLHVPN